MYTLIGGQPRGEVVSLTVHGRLPVSEDYVLKNLEHSRGLGLPKIEPRSAFRRNLRVVGGGPSIKGYVNELRRATDVWAINGAWRWCMENGIDATLFVVDPHPDIVPFARGADKAIVATTCCPEVFGALKNADVRTIEFGDPYKGGQSAASLTPHVAAMMGHASVTFYGCESSYDLSGRYAYGVQSRPDQLIVECGGEEYLTAADYYIYAQELAAMIRELPGYLREKSGGLLRAMVEHKTFRIRWISEELASEMTVEPLREAV